MPSKQPWRELERVGGSWFLQTPACCTRTDTSPISSDSWRFEDESHPPGSSRPRSSTPHPRRIPFFEDMSTNMKWTLCSKFEPVRFGPGEDILSEGDKAEKCWVMLEGVMVCDGALPFVRTPSPG